MLFILFQIDLRFDAVALFFFPSPMGLRPAPFSTSVNSRSVVESKA